MSEKQTYFHTFKLIIDFAPVISVRLKNALIKNQEYYYAIIVKRGSCTVFAGPMEWNNWITFGTRSMSNHQSHGRRFINSIIYWPTENNIRTRVRSIPSRIRVAGRSSVVTTIRWSRRNCFYVQKLSVPKRASFRVGN